MKKIILLVAVILSLGFLAQNKELKKKSFLTFAPRARAEKNKIDLSLIKVIKR